MSIEVLEETLTQRLTDANEFKERQQVIDPTMIVTLVTAFIGMIQGCRKTQGVAAGAKTPQSITDQITNPGRRQYRLAERLVLRQQFQGNRRAYRDGQGDAIAREVVQGGKTVGIEKIEAALQEQSEDTAILDAVEMPT